MVNLERTEMKALSTRIALKILLVKDLKVRAQVDTKSTTDRIKKESTIQNLFQ
jgi:hypothetical protein